VVYSKLAVSILEPTEIAFPTDCPCESGAGRIGKGIDEVLQHVIFSDVKRSRKTIEPMFIELVMRVIPLIASHPHLTDPDDLPGFTVKKVFRIWIGHFHGIENI